MVGGEYEPEDSRDVTLPPGDPGKPSGWHKRKDRDAGELAPGDTRNVTGTASTPDGHWTDPQVQTPRGVPQPDPFSAEDAAQGASTAADTADERAAED